MKKYFKKINIKKLKNTRYWQAEKNTHYSMYPLQGCGHWACREVYMLLFYE